MKAQFRELLVMCARIDQPTACDLAAITGLLIAHGVDGGEIDERLGEPITAALYALSEQDRGTKAAVQLGFRSLEEVSAEFYGESSAVA